MNDFFIENSIGWKIDNGQIEFRGSEAFETMIRDSRQVQHNAGHLTASSELHQAISDLSKRPNADVTGAIQHSMASLECVARELVGDGKATLGDIMKRYGLNIPKPLDDVIIKAWGYASEHGRHLREGRDPSLKEAELVVGLCACLGGYLIKCKSENV